MWQNSCTGVTYRHLSVESSDMKLLRLEMQSKRRFGDYIRLLMIESILNIIICREHTVNYNSASPFYISIYSINSKSYEPRFKIVWCIIMVTRTL